VREKPKTKEKKEAPGCAGRRLGLNPILTRWGFIYTERRPGRKKAVLTGEIGPPVIRGGARPEEQNIEVRTDKTSNVPGKSWGQPKTVAGKREEYFEVNKKTKRRKKGKKKRRRCHRRLPVRR